MKQNDYALSDERNLFGAHHSKRVDVTLDEQEEDSLSVVEDTVRRRVCVMGGCVFAHLCGFFFTHWHRAHPCHKHMVKFCLTFTRT
jgi:hypothetical protein